MVCQLVVLRKAPQFCIQETFCFLNIERKKNIKTRYPSFDTCGGIGKEYILTEKVDVVGPEYILLV